MKAVKSHDARNAVLALLAGKPVPVEKTRVFGCSTKWAEKQADARKSLARWDAEPVTPEPIDVAGVAKLLKDSGPKLTVINVWASWCGPCVAELPEFVTLTGCGRPFRLVTISLDDPEKHAEAIRVLKENHVAAANYILKTGGHDAFAEARDKEWPGARSPTRWWSLRAEKSSTRKVGATDPLEVKQAIVSHLGRTY